MQRFLRPCAVLFCLLALPFTTGAALNAVIQDEIPLIGAELFGVDQSHSQFEFSIRFMGMSTVKGHFDDYDLSIVYDAEDMTGTSVTLIVDVASIDTGSSWRDRDLQSERFFDAEKHPWIVFQSERMEATGEGYIVHGSLSIKGTTRQIAVPFTHPLKRTLDTGWGNIRIGFEGAYTLNRNDYGIHGGDFWGVQALDEYVTIEFGFLGTIMNMEKIAYRSGDKRSIGEELQAIIEEKDMYAALSRYEEIIEKEAESFMITEGEINKLGYKLMEQRRFKEALKIFQLNVKAYPESANVYDSMGQAYAMLGERAYAISAYNKALEINPYMPSALEMLRRLED